MKKYLIYIVIITVMFGCNADKKAERVTSANILMADTTAVADPVAKIVKTADMRFRVKDVQQTKEQLSAAIKSQGGAIVEFSIQSFIQESDKVKYTIDSLKEITSYRKEGLLIAKIPAEKLDDFTNMVAKMAVFVDQQAMKMDDQRLTYLTNRYKAQNRVDAVKTIDKTVARKNTNVTTLLSIKDDEVNKKIENMSIDQRVKYSTITLNFYQNNTVKVLVIGNDNLYDYRPGFFQRLGLNLIDGWIFFKEFILGLSKLWPLIVVGIAVFFGIRYFIRRKKA